MVGNDPVNRRDYLGLASLSEVTNGTMYYTWNLGWMDKSHNGENALSKGLVEGWKKLKSAEANEIGKNSLINFIEKYQRRFGAPTFPAYFQKYKETKEGVSGGDAEK